MDSADPGRSRQLFVRQVALNFTIVKFNLWIAIHLGLLYFTIVKFKRRANASAFGEKEPGGIDDRGGQAG
jgi:hypothetical protein